MRIIFGSVLSCLLIGFTAVANAEMPSFALPQEASNETAEELSISLAHFGGEWTQIVDERDHVSRLESIDAAVSDLSWMVRGMASGVLEKTTVPPQGVKFHWTGEELMQVIDRRDGVMHRPVLLDGEVRNAPDHEGTDTRTEWHRTAQGLEVRWAQERAFGTTRYSFDPTDETMRVDYEIHVTALDGVSPISYGSRFARKSLPKVSAAAPAQRSDNGAATPHDEPR